MRTERSRTALLCISLAACGGSGTDIAPTLALSERSDEEIAFLLGAAQLSLVYDFDAELGTLGAGDDPCPPVTWDGNVATVTGGCTNMEGKTIEGTLIVTNPWAFRSMPHDPGRPTLHEARNVTITRPGGAAKTYHGHLERSGLSTVLDADVTITELGVAVRSDLRLACSDPHEPVCTTRGGIELGTLGGVLVSGTSRYDRELGAAIELTLQGADRLTLRGTSACAAWSIEDTDRGTTCP